MPADVRISPQIEHRLFSAITLNWRGRPLASHQVIVNSIAATTTATGLTVRAGLDDGHYPKGAKVSDEQMNALPLDCHGWHGDWNYTLRPQPPAPQHPPPPRPATRAPARPDWAHPALTGLATRDWDQMLRALAAPYQAQRDAGLYLRRGGPPARKPAGGHPPALTLAEQALITVLRRRFRTPQHVLAELFGVVTGTIVKAERQLRPLLDQHAPRPPGRHTHQDPGRANRLRLGTRDRPHPQSQTSALIICAPLASSARWCRGTRRGENPSAVQGHRVPRIMPAGRWLA